MPVTRVLGIALLAVAIAAPGALAHPKGGGSKRYPFAAAPSASQLERYDANRNGALEEAEREAMKRDILRRLQPARERLLQKYDQNQNGTLEPAEKQLMKQERDAQRTMIHERAVQLHDANKDGKLDAGERQAMRASNRAYLEKMRTQMLEVFDANRNGTLDPVEREAMRAKAETSRQLALKMYDRDQDGRISAAERSTATSRNAAASKAEAAQQASVTAARTLTDVRAVVEGSRGTRDVRVDFTLGAPGRVSIRVFDAAGRVVRNVMSGAVNAGANSIRWDTIGQDGRAVANGLYWVSIEAFGAKVNRKVAIIR